MEDHHDLRKFITELPVAQRCVVLSSGREVDCDVDARRVTVQYRASSDDRAGVGRSPNGSRIDNVGWLTPGAGIESSTALTSDLTAAEALQEAETEVGVAGMVDRSADAARAGCRTDVPIGLPFDRSRPYGLKVSRFVPAHMQENRCSWWKDGDRGNCVGGNDNASDLAACRRAN